MQQTSTKRSKSRTANNKKISAKSKREAELADKPLAQLIKYSYQRIPWFKLRGRYESMPENMNLNASVGTLGQNSMISMTGGQSMQAGLT